MLRFTVGLSAIAAITVIALVVKSAMDEPLAFSATIALIILARPLGSLIMNRTL